MDEHEFEDLVNEAVESLPIEFKDLLENVNIVVEDLPSGYQMQKMKQKGVHGMLLGLYEGIPQTKRGRYGVGGILPDKITIFRLPILHISRTSDQTKKQVRDTVLHEIGHHFGMSEEQIHDAMKGRS